MLIQIYLVLSTLFIAWLADQDPGFGIIIKILLLLLTALGAIATYSSF